MDNSVMSATVILVLTLVGLTTGAYFFLMIFYPEWVGITGRSAKKTLEEHREGSSVDETDYFNKLDR